ncbi:hypothetical protein BDR05DRAFT_968564 [Suillus weaverae]|nr:hypothetical protein BDR05DRAFT_968564 [Suillus weaverae]
MVTSGEQTAVTTTVSGVGWSKESFYYVPLAYSSIVGFTQNSLAISTPADSAPSIWR